MPSKLLIDKSEGDFAEALANCKVGDEKTFEVTVIVTADDDQKLEGDVSALVYEEPNNNDSAEAEPAPPEKAGPAGKMPPAPQRGGGPGY